MKPLCYSCNKDKLDDRLRKAFHERGPDKETLDFQRKESRFFRVKFCFFIILGVLGWKHYEIMGLLGYQTFLLNEGLIKELLAERSGKKLSLLDIGAGNGSITQKFEKYTQNISCLEPSASFQKQLRKRKYTITDVNDNEKYDLISILNVFDICEKPEEILNHAIRNLKPQGMLIASLPFPIFVRSRDNNNARKTNRLEQWPSVTFEEGVSRFCTDFLLPNDLEVTYFTRLPYIVSLPESQKTTVYDNGLFVCKRK